MTVADGMVVDDDMSFDMAFGESTGVQAQEPEPQAQEPEPQAQEPEPQAQEPEPQAQVQQIDDNRFRNLEAEIAALKQPKQPEPPKIEEIAPVLSKEESEFLDGFKTEWPDAQKALELQRRVLEAEMEKRVQTAVKTAVETMQGNLAPFVKAAQETAQDKFIREITSVHQDASTLLPEVERWVNTLPAGLSSAFNGILDNGSSADVIKVFDTYKAMTGKIAQQTQQNSQQQQATEKAKQDKLAKMQGVRTERTGISAETDPYDFETAFAQATKTR